MTYRREGRETGSGNIIQNKNPQDFGDKLRTFKTSCKGAFIYDVNGYLGTRGSGKIWLKSDGVGGWGWKELSDIINEWNLSGFCAGFNRNHSLNQSHKAAWPGITEVSFSLQNSDLPNLTNKIRNAVTSCKCLASINCLNFAQPDGEAMAIKQVK